MGTTSRLPKLIKLQLTRLVDEAPAGGDRLHEIKYDGYRTHARIDGELCALNDDGVPVFSAYRRRWTRGRTDQLVFFAFDLLFGEATASLPLVERSRWPEIATVDRQLHKSPRISQETTSGYP